MLQPKVDHLLLDCDGVLNSERIELPVFFSQQGRYIFQIHEKNLHALAMLVLRLNVSKISIISNWRYFFGAQRLKEILEPAVGDIPLAATSQRFHINTALDKVGLIEAYSVKNETSLILDDWELPLSECYGPIFYRVDSASGLTTHDVDKIEALIRRN